MRNCIGERSCTSSTTMWPKARMSSSDTVEAGAAGSGDAASPWGQNPNSDAVPSSERLGRTRAGRHRRGPSKVRASSISAASPDVHGAASSEALRGRYSRCTSRGFKIPLPALASNARAPRRSCRNSWGDRRGHMRSRASLTSGTRRNRCARSLCSSAVGSSSAPSTPVRLSRARYSSARTRSTWDSTNRRRALCVPGRRRAMPTMSSVAPALRRSTPAPKGTSTSRRSGRWRVRTARVSTLTMRTSPFSLATAGSSTARTRTSGTSPETVERLTPVSPSDGRTCSM